MLDQVAGTPAELSEGRAKRLANLRPFQKGVSGNPGGKPKKREDIRELARKASPEAFARIISLVNSDDEKVALVAAKEVLDRAWGKATVQVDHKHEHNFTAQFEAFVTGLPERARARIIDVTAAETISEDHLGTDGDGLVEGPGTLCDDSFEGEPGALAD